MAEETKKGGKKRNYKAKYNYYEVKGDKVERKNKSCPKCGPATFLAVHENRVSCGKCGYSEVEAKEAPEKPTEAQPTEAPKTEEAPKEEKPTEAPVEKPAEVPKPEAPVEKPAEESKSEEKKE